jgi:hypothetical protein
MRAADKVEKAASTAAQVQYRDAPASSEANRFLEESGIESEQTIRAIEALKGTMVLVGGECGVVHQLGYRSPPHMALNDSSNDGCRSIIPGSEGR